MNKSNTELDGERLRTLLSDPAYTLTIGRWLDEELAAALTTMEDAKGEALLSAQGRYVVLVTVKRRIEWTLAQADAIREKRLRDTARENANKNQGIPYE